jgi:hypothetical protein
MGKLLNNAKLKASLIGMTTGDVICVATKVLLDGKNFNNGSDRKLKI